MVQGSSGTTTLRADGTSGMHLEVGPPIGLVVATVAGFDLNNKLCVYGTRVPLEREQRRIASESFKLGDRRLRRSHNLG